MQSTRSETDEQEVWVVTREKDNLVVCVYATEQAAAMYVDHCNAQGGSPFTFDVYPVIE